jgi:hypothetical protein
MLVAALANITEFVAAAAAAVWFSTIMQVCEEAVELLVAAANQFL